MLGEGKGADITGAIQQFEWAGQQLGVQNIVRQEIVARGLQPGYAINNEGLLTWIGRVYTVNGKPIHMTIVKE